jgi:hypothetical protein
MRLVADESCDFGIVRGLRSVGHDVVSIAETLAGIDDESVSQAVFASVDLCNRTAGHE